MTISNTFFTGLKTPFLYCLHGYMAGSLKEHVVCRVAGLNPFSTRIKLSRK